MANRKHGVNVWGKGKPNGAPHWKRRTNSRSPSPEGQETKTDDAPPEKQKWASNSQPIITVNGEEIVKTDKVLLLTQCFPFLSPGVGFRREVMDRVWSNMALLRAKGMKTKNLETEYYDYFLKKSGGFRELRALVQRLARVSPSVLSQPAKAEARLMLSYYCARLEELEKCKNSRSFLKMHSYDPEVVANDALITAEACHSVPQLQMGEVLLVFVVDPIDVKVEYELTLGRLKRALELFEGGENVVAHNMKQLEALTKPSLGVLTETTSSWTKPDIILADKRTLQRIIYLLFMSLSSAVWLDTNIMRFHEAGHGHTRWTRFITVARDTKYYEDMHGFSGPKTIYALVCALADGCVVTSYGASKNNK